MKVIYVVLALCSFPLWAKVTIISDFDDTIKRSNIVNLKTYGIANSVLWRKAYTGMPELFLGLRNDTEALYVLSVSPLVIKPAISALLNSYDIRVKAVFTRDLIASQEKIAYKRGRINQVIQNHSDNLLLFGDDIEADHDVYLQVEKEHPERIEQIYIHNVVNRVLPNNIFHYFTAYDVAVNEYKKGRLRRFELMVVANAILTTELEYMYRVIPDYAYCPQSSSEFTYQSPEELLALSTQVQAKLVNYCQTR